jgi:hypothetical protein
MESFVNEKGCAHIPMMEEDVAACMTVPFDLLQTNLRPVLETWGCAIIPDVLDEVTVAALEAEWGDDLRTVLDVEASTDTALVKRILSNPTRNWPVDVRLGKKFVTHFGLPQGKLAWHTRMHPRVREVYEVIYNTGEVCVGMDTIFYQNTPPCRDPAATTSLWPHFDQNMTVPGSGSYEEFQGVVYLWEANETTSATVLWPQTHGDVYRQFMAGVGQHSKHFCMVKDDGLMQQFVKNARRVPVPAGGMLLWNSRLMHQGWPNGPRLAVPVCYEPSCRRSGEVLNKKRELVLSGLPSTHWASICEQHSLSRNEVPAKVGLELVHRAHLQAIDPATGHIRVEIDRCL